MAIDDFGTGYSNLGYLSDIPFDYLKIDRKFVSQIGSSIKDEELVKATIAIAKALNMKTIAEGVETAEQQTFLEAQGCDYAQGYYICKPQPLASVMDFVQSR